MNPKDFFKKLYECIQVSVKAYVVCVCGGGNCGGQKWMLKLLELELQVAEDY